MPAKLKKEHHTTYHQLNTLRSRHKLRTPHSTLSAYHTCRHHSPRIWYYGLICHSLAPPRVSEIDNHSHSELRLRTPALCCELDKHIAPRLQVPYTTCNHPMPMRATMLLLEAREEGAHDVHATEILRSFRHINERRASTSTLLPLLQTAQWHLLRASRWPLQ